MSASQEIAALRDAIRDHDRQYYVEATPSISDRDYDRLLEQLKQLEAAHPDLITPDSPTQRVGGKPIEGFPKVSHAVPMLSIDNTYDTESLRKWSQRCCDTLGDHVNSEGRLPGGFLAEPKIDGVAINLRYEGGQLVLGSTRGDGATGDDVTPNIRAIRAIPLSLREDDAPPLPPVLEVRGEIFMPAAEFQRINQEFQNAGEEGFANPRNATAGTLKQLDSNVVASRRLQFLAHGRGEQSGDRLASHSEFLSALARWGVPTSPLPRRCESIDDVWTLINEFDAVRAELPYGVDGVVVRVDRYDLQEILGTTSRFPRWCIAYKYPAEQAITKLLKVDWQVGKTGKLTPRATMEPIFVAGTTVQHATLHNLGEIYRKDIRIGDTVVIEKAGEIIPQVVEVDQSKRTANSLPIKPPTSCPECSGNVESEQDAAGKETARYCMNPECPAQLRERLIHFSARGQMDIDGMGEKMVEQLADAELLNSFGDIFTLREKRQQLMELERMGGKKTENLLNGIEEAKKRGLDRVLVGLGIRHVGSTASKVLARHYGSLDALLDASKEDIQSFKVSGKESGIGPEIAASLYHFLHSDVGQHVIDELRSSGLTLAVSRSTEEIPNQPFAGKSFVVTGKLEKYSREEVHALVENNGGHASSSVSKNTNYLVAGAKAGSKLTKAEKLGVEVLSEVEFEELLKGKHSTPR